MELFPAIHFIFIFLPELRSGKKIKDAVSIRAKIIYCNTFFRTITKIFSDEKNGIPLYHHTYYSLH
ncbi:hypothetical protein DBR25_16590, partial [Chryseobacterium sp. HMWF001]